MGSSRTSRRVISDSIAKRRLDHSQASSHLPRSCPWREADIGGDCHFAVEPRGGPSGYRLVRLIAALRKPWNRRCRPRRVTRQCHSVLRQRSQCSRVTIHSITSSAPTSTLCGTVRPSALAAFMLTTSSSLVDCSNGMSPGFVPLRILSMKLAERRVIAVKSPW